MITVTGLTKFLLFVTVGRFTHGYPAGTKRTWFNHLQVTISPTAIGHTVQRRRSPCSTTRRCALPEVSCLMDTSTELLAFGGVLSNENIKKAFSLATFGPQLLWLLMIVVPKAEITKKIMGEYTAILFFCLIHLFVVVASASQQDGTAPIAEFQGVFNASPDADPQAAMVGMMRYPNFVTEEWAHVLTWDLFVGRWIWIDGLKRNIFTAHSVLLCNLIGPPGLLLHFLTCWVSSKVLPPSEKGDENV